MFVGGSQAILRMQELIDKAARSGSTVLIIGESGVGKDVASKRHAPQKRIPTARKEIRALWQSRFTDMSFTP